MNPFEYDYLSMRFDEIIENVRNNPESVLVDGEKNEIIFKYHKYSTTKVIVNYGYEADGILKRVTFYFFDIYNRFNATLEFLAPFCVEILEKFDKLFNELKAK